MWNFGPPVLASKPKDVEFDSGVTFTYSFASITDPDGDLYTVTLAGLPEFCTWILAEMKFTCDTLDYENVSYKGDYNLVLTLTDIRLYPDLVENSIYRF